LTGRTLDLTQPFFHNAGFNPDLPLPTMAITRSVMADGYSMEELRLCTHVGTHMDAPSHVFEAGPSIDEFAVGAFHGTGAIVDLRELADETPIDAALLESRSPPFDPGAVVCLVTGWGALRARTKRYADGSPYLTGDGAAWIASRRAAGVAIDHFSVGGRGTPDKVLPSHTELLGAGIWIVEEALFPDELLEGAWQIVALPWRVVGGSGAPTRMIAIEQPR
jgi:kynurenine formamidase